MAAAAAATVAESILVVRSSSSAPRGLHVLAATGPGKTLGEIGGTGGTKRARVRSSSSSPLAFPVVDGMRLARATPTRTSRPSLEHARSALTLTSESGRARLPAAATGVVARVGGQRRRWAHTQAAARVREDDDEHRDDGAQLQQQHNGLGRLSAPTTAAPSATSTLSSSTLHHPSTTTSSAAPAQGSVASSTPTPLSRYDDLVARGLLRDDAHQRQIIERLQAMHEQLVAYHPPAVPEKVTRRAGRGGGLLGGLGRWFGGGGASGGGGAAVHGLAKLDDVPKGMYLYGDVGTGKVSSSLPASPPVVRGGRALAWNQQASSGSGHGGQRKEVVDSCLVSQARRPGKLKRRWRVACKAMIPPNPPEAANSGLSCESATLFTSH